MNLTQLYHLGKDEIQNAKHEIVLQTYGRRCSTQPCSGNTFGCNYGQWGHFVIFFDPLSDSARAPPSRCWQRGAMGASLGMEGSGHPWAAGLPLAGQGCGDISWTAAQPQVGEAGLTWGPGWDRQGINTHDTSQVALFVAAVIFCFHFAILCNVKGLV